MIEYFGDLCRCNQCMKTVLVAVGEDVCPNCGEMGYLMDIQQECNLIVDDDRAFK